MPGTKEVFGNIIKVAGAVEQIEFDPITEYVPGPIPVVGLRVFVVVEALKVAVPGPKICVHV
jgi:hypothetical protein